MWEGGHKNEKNEVPVVLEPHVRSSQHACGIDCVAWGSEHHEPSSPAS